MTSSIAILRQATWVALVLLASAAATIGCGGSGGGGSGAGGAGGTPTGGGGGFGGEPEGGAGAEGVIRDTSGYTGRLAWSRGPRTGVRVWDLEESRTAFQLFPDRDGELMGYGEPALATDGSTLVYTEFEPYVLTSFFTRVHRVDLETEEVVLFPRQGLEDDQIRNTFHPSVDADGSRVAVAASVSEDLGDGLYSNGTLPVILVWDVTDDTVIAVTTDESRARLPRIDGAGETVVFLSDRDGPWDFYRAPVEPNAPITRLPFSAHPEIRNLDDIEAAGRLSASRDLSKIAFLARTDDGFGVFVLDTESGGIVRLDDGEGLVSSVAISGDGEWVAWWSFVIDEENLDMRGGLHTARSTKDEASVRRIGQSVAVPLALSYDGSQIAWVEGLVELWVSDIGFEDPRQVSGDEEGDVIGLLGMHLTF